MKSWNFFYAKDENRQARYTSSIQTLGDHRDIHPIHPFLSDHIFKRSLIGIKSMFLKDEDSDKAITPIPIEHNDKGININKKNQATQ